MYIELHTHSWYSRGSILGEECTHSPIEIVRKAKEIGLNGIAVTDHNSLKSWFNLKKLKFNDFVVIPGEEISTNQGHILAIGISEEIKPKQHVLETIDKIHQQGGIAIAPHPFDIGKQGVGTFSRYADAIEVFNSMCLDRFSNLRAKRFAEKFN
ncbi:MAG: metal-dependent phosphoesterase, partial [Candidatus Aenigmarchaeota archaeon ex4484_56]